MQCPYVGKIKGYLFFLRILIKGYLGNVSRMIAEKWFVSEVYWYYLSNYLREKRILKRGLSYLLVLPPIHNTL
jgi:hypothetical protein